MPKTWVNDYFTNDWVSYYNKTCRFYFAYSHVDVLDMSQQAQENLLIKLHKLKEPASEALVKTIYKNNLHDLHRKLFGRHRPPKWLVGMGTLWVQVWEWFCLKNIPMYEIEEYMPQISPQQSETMVLKIKQNQACPKAKPNAVELDDVDNSNVIELTNDALHEPNHPEQWIIKLELTQFINSLLETNNERLDPTLLGDSLFETYQQIQAEINLTSDEIIMLKMRFHEDESINDIAQALFKPSYQIRRDLEKTLAKIQQVLSHFGIDKQHLAVQGL